MEKDFGKIKKNENTDIIVRVDDFGGKPGITIREFTTSERYTGFTKSGTRIPAESLQQFKDLINMITPEDLVISPEAAKKAADKAAEKKPAKEKKSENPNPKQEVLDEDLF